ncbi:MAG: hypothetical protein D6B25_13500 [Desulfobulbaceae bacterium]|nr:MAG: hypothetical protein D6B25_13500 [Desulfobulbaceae bacterium]
MITRRTIITILTIALILLLNLQTGSRSAMASSETLGATVKIGTLGPGVEVSGAIIDGLRIRGGFNYLTYSFDSTIGDIDYEFEPEFNSISAILDWHPFGGGFHVSGGLFLNNNVIGATGVISGSAIPSEFSQYAAYRTLVSISGDVEFNPVAPYLGIGWRSNSGEPGLGFACELGVMFQGAPDVTGLRVNGPIDINGISEVRAFLADQEKEIEDELEPYQYYPVASVMLIYNF